MNLKKRMFLYPDLWSALESATPIPSHVYLSVILCGLTFLLAYIHMCEYSNIFLEKQEKTPWMSIPLQYSSYLPLCFYVFFLNIILVVIILLKISFIIFLKLKYDYIIFSFHFPLKLFLHTPPSSSLSNPWLPALFNCCFMYIDS